MVANADFAPPQPAYQNFDYLSAEIDQQLAELQQVLDEDVAQFANLLGDLDILAIATPARGAAPLAVSFHATRALRRWVALRINSPAGCRPRQMVTDRSASAPCR